MERSRHQLSTNHSMLFSGSTTSKPKHVEKKKEKNERDEKYELQENVYLRWAATIIPDPPKDPKDLAELSYATQMTQTITGQHVELCGNKIDDFMSILAQIGDQKTQPADLADGQHRAVLSLWWSFVQAFWRRNAPEPICNDKVQEALRGWCTEVCREYDQVSVSDFTSSWRDGHVFNVLLHNFDSKLISLPGVASMNAIDRIEHAFFVAESQLGVPRLLYARELHSEYLDSRSVVVYLMTLYRSLLQHSQHTNLGMQSTQAPLQGPPTQAPQPIVPQQQPPASPPRQQIKQKLHEEQPQNTQVDPADISSKLLQENSQLGKTQESRPALQSAPPPSVPTLPHPEIARKSERATTKRQASMDNQPTGETESVRSRKSSSSSQKSGKSKRARKEEMAKDFNDCLEEVLTWLLEAEDEIGVLSDVETDDLNTVKKQFREYEQFMANLTESQESVGKVLHRGHMLSQKTDNEEERAAIDSQLQLVNSRWEELRALAMDRQTLLQSQLTNLQHTQLTEICQWLSETEQLIEEAGPVPSTVNEAIKQVDSHVKLQKRIDDFQNTIAVLSSFVAVVEEGEGEHSELSVQQLEGTLQEVGSRWENICQWAEQRATHLDGLAELIQHSDTVFEQLGAWLKEQEHELLSLKSAHHLESPEQVAEQVHKLQEAEAALEAEHGSFVRASQLSCELVARLDSSNGAAANNVRRKLDTLTQRWDNLVTRIEEHSHTLVRSGKADVKQISGDGEMAEKKIKRALEGADGEEPEKKTKKESEVQSLLQEQAAEASPATETEEPGHEILERFLLHVRKLSTELSPLQDWCQNFNISRKPAEARKMISVCQEKLIEIKEYEARVNRLQLELERIHMNQGINSKQLKTANDAFEAFAKGWAKIVTKISEALNVLTGHAEDTEEGTVARGIDEWIEGCDRVLSDMHRLNPTDSRARAQKLRDQLETQRKNLAFIEKDVVKKAILSKGLDIIDKRLQQVIVAAAQAFKPSTSEHLMSEAVSEIEKILEGEWASVGELDKLESDVETCHKLLELTKKHGVPNPIVERVETRRAETQERRNNTLTATHTTTTALQTLNRLSDQLQKVANGESAEFTVVLSSLNTLRDQLAAAETQRKEAEKAVEVMLSGQDVPPQVVSSWRDKVSQLSLGWDNLGSSIDDTISCVKREQKKSIQKSIDSGEEVLRNVERAVDESGAAIDAEELSEKLDELEQLLEQLPEFTELETSVKALDESFVRENFERHQKRKEDVVEKAKNRVEHLHTQIGQCEVFEKKVADLHRWAGPFAAMLAQRKASDVSALDVPDEYKEPLQSGELIKVMQKEFEEHGKTLNEIKEFVERTDGQSSQRLSEQLEHATKIFTEIDKQFTEFKQPSRFEERLTRCSSILSHIENSLDELTGIDCSSVEHGIVEANNTIKLLVKVDEQLVELEQGRNKLMKDGILGKKEAEEIKDHIHLARKKTKELGVRAEGAVDRLEDCVVLKNKLTENTKEADEILSRIECRLDEYAREESTVDEGQVEILINEWNRNESLLKTLEETERVLMTNAVHVDEALSSQRRRRRADELKTRLDGWNATVREMNDDEETLLLEVDELHHTLLEKLDDAEKQKDPSQIAKSLSFLRSHRDRLSSRARRLCMLNPRLNHNEMVGEVNERWAGVESRLEEALPQPPPLPPTPPTHTSFAEGVQHLADNFSIASKFLDFDEFPVQNVQQWMERVDEAAKWMDKQRTLLADIVQEGRRLADSGRMELDTHSAIDKLDDLIDTANEFESEIERNQSEAEISNERMEGLQRDIAASTEVINSLRKRDLADPEIAQATRRDLSERDPQLCSLSRRAAELHTTLPGRSSASRDSTLDQLNSLLSDLETALANKATTPTQKSSTIVREEQPAQSQSPTKDIGRKSPDRTSLSSLGASLAMEVAHGTDVNTTEDESDMRVEQIREDASTPAPQAPAEGDRRTPEPEPLATQREEKDSTKAVPSTSEATQEPRVEVQTVKKQTAPPAKTVPVISKEESTESRVSIDIPITFEDVHAQTPTASEKVEELVERDRSEVKKVDETSIKPEGIQEVSAEKSYKPDEQAVKDAQRSSPEPRPVEVTKASRAGIPVTDSTFQGDVPQRIPIEIGMERHWLEVVPEEEQMDISEKSEVPTQETAMETDAKPSEPGPTVDKEPLPEPMEASTEEQYSTPPEGDISEAVFLEAMEHPVSDQREGVSTISKEGTIEPSEEPGGAAKEVNRVVLLAEVPHDSDAGRAVDQMVQSVEGAEASGDATNIEKEIATQEAALPKKETIGLKHGQPLEERNLSDAAEKPKPEENRELERSIKESAPERELLPMEHKVAEQLLHTEVNEELLFDNRPQAANGRFCGVIPEKMRTEVCSQNIEAISKVTPHLLLPEKHGDISQKVEEPSNLEAPMDIDASEKQTAAEAPASEAESVVTEEEPVVTEAEPVVTEVVLSFNAPDPIDSAGGQVITGEKLVGPSKTVRETRNHRPKEGTRGKVDSKTPSPSRPVQTPTGEIVPDDMHSIIHYEDNLLPIETINPEAGVEGVLSEVPPRQGQQASLSVPASPVQKKVIEPPESTAEMRKSTTPGEDAKLKGTAVTVIRDMRGASEELPISVGLTVRSSDEEVDLMDEDLSTSKVKEQLKALADQAEKLTAKETPEEIQGKPEEPPKTKEELKEEPVVGKVTEPVESAPKPSSVKKTDVMSTSVPPSDAPDMNEVFTILDEMEDEIAFEEEFPLEVVDQPNARYSKMMKQLDEAVKAVQANQMTLDMLQAECTMERISTLRRDIESRRARASEDVKEWDAFHKALTSCEHNLKDLMKTTNKITSEAALKSIAPEQLDHAQKKVSSCEEKMMSVLRTAGTVLPRLKEGALRERSTRERLLTVEEQFAQCNRTIRSLSEMSAVDPTEILHRIEGVDFWCDETESDLSVNFHWTNVKAIDDQLEKLNARLSKELEEQRTELVSLETAKDRLVQIPAVDVQIKHTVRRAVSQAAKRIADIRSDLSDKVRFLNEMKTKAQELWLEVHRLENHSKEVQRRADATKEAVIYTPSVQNVTSVKKDATQLQEDAGRLRIILNKSYTEKPPIGNNEAETILNVVASCDSAIEAANELPLRETSDLESSEMNLSTVIEVSEHSELHPMPSLAASTSNEGTVAASSDRVESVHDEVHTSEESADDEDEITLDRTTVSQSGRQSREEGAERLNPRETQALQSLTQLALWLSEIERDAGLSVDLSNGQQIKELLNNIQSIIDQLRQRVDEPVFISDGVSSQEVKRKAADLSANLHRVSNACQKRKCQLNKMAEQQKTFEQLRSGCEMWITEAQTQLGDSLAAEASEEAISAELVRVEALLAQVDEQHGRIKEFNARGNALLDEFPRDDAHTLSHLMSKINMMWTQFNDNVRIRRAVLEASLRSRSDLASALGEVEQWMDRIASQMKELERQTANTQTLKDTQQRREWMQQEKNIRHEIDAHDEVLKSVQEMGKKILGGLEPGQEKQKIKKQKKQTRFEAMDARLNDLNTRWATVIQVHRDIRDRLQNAEQEWEKVTNNLSELINWTENKSKLLLAQQPVGGCLSTVLEQGAFVKNLEREMEDRTPHLKNTIAQAHSFLMQHDLRPKMHVPGVFEEEEEALTEKEMEERRYGLQIHADCNKLKEKWTELGLQANEWGKVVSSAAQKLQDLERALAECQLHLSAVEQELESARAVENLRLEELKGARHEVEELTNRVDQLRVHLDDANDACGKILAADTPLDQHPKNQLDAVNQRFHAVKTSVRVRAAALRNAFADFGPSSEHFLNHSIGLPWQRAISKTNQLPYYIDHNTEHTQWEHPVWVEMAKELNSFNRVKFIAYRTAMKLRALQKRLCLDLISLPMLQKAFDRLEGLSNEECPGLEGMVCSLLPLFEHLHSLHPNLVKSVALAVDLCINFLLNLYDPCRDGILRVLSFKIALISMCNAQLEDKYRALFELVAQENQADQKHIALLFYDLIHLPRLVGEAAAFGGSNVEPSVRSCFETVKLASHIQVGSFLEWLKKEPQSLVWLPVMHRLASAEFSKHQAKCNICKMFPIVGLRYRCLHCFNFDMCQNCFFSQRTAKNHKLNHPMQEYSVPTTSGEDVRDFAHILRNKLGKRRKTIGYLPVEVCDEGLPLASAPTALHNANTAPVHTRIALCAERLASLTQNEPAEPREEMTVSDVKSPLQLISQVEQMQKDELDQLLQRLQLENLELKKELEKRRTAAMSTPDLDRTGFGGTMPRLRDGTRSGTLPRLGTQASSQHGRSVPSLHTAKSTNDVADEARALRMHKQRLEHRSRILEQQNSQLEMQLERLKKMIQQRDSASVVRSVTGDAEWETRGNGHPPPTYAQTPQQTTQGPSDWDSEAEGHDPVPSANRMSSLLATVDDLGRAMESLVVSVVADSDEER